MNSLEIVNKKIKNYKHSLTFYENKINGNEFMNAVITEIEYLEKIKQDLEILNKFVKYSSLRYFKNYIEEDKFYLNNFDLDSKDENRIINRINDIEILIQFIEQHEVGDSQ